MRERERNKLRCQNPKQKVLSVKSEDMWSENSGFDWISLLLSLVLENSIVLRFNLDVLFLLFCCTEKIRLTLHCTHAVDTCALVWSCIVLFALSFRIIHTQSCMRKLNRAQPMNEEHPAYFRSKFDKSFVKFEAHTFPMTRLINRCNLLSLSKRLGLYRDYIKKTQIKILRWLRTKYKFISTTHDRHTHCELLFFLPSFFLFQ